MEPVLEALARLLELVNTLTPLAALILLIGVLYVQLWKQPTKQELNVVKNNHLHELPSIAANAAEMVGSLRRLEDGQTRIENGQTKAFAEINTKIDGLS